jgi:hypothetical protein
LNRFLLEKEVEVTSGEVNSTVFLDSMGKTPK